jgi:hypothetical protein
MKATLTIICLLSSFQTFYGQDWSWAQSLGDTSANTVSNAMCLYKGSDVIVTGAFGSASLKIGPFTMTGAGRDDIFIARFNDAGDCIWAAGFGGTSDEAGKAVAADSQGNIYLAGSFSSRSITFGTHTIQNKGDKDGFLVKINPGKVVEWAHGIGSLSDEEVTGIAVDSQDNIYVTGNISNDGIFIFKFDKSGNLLWERWGSAEGHQYYNYATSNSIAVDDNNNCYITGGFYRQLVFDGKNTLKSSLDQHGYYQYNAFLAKYDPHGNFLDAVAISDFRNGRSICLSFNRLLIGGDRIEYGAGWGWPLQHSEIYLGKYSTSLNQIWLRSAGGLTPYQSLDLPHDISADENGNIYQTGSFFSEGIKFGPDSLENHFNKDYFYRQAFVFKYDSLGNPVWGKAAGDIHCEVGRAIQVISEDTFYLSGNFESKQMEFGSHILENNSMLRNAYVHLRPRREYRNTFVFLAKYYDDVTYTPVVPGNNRFNLYPNPAGEYVTVDTGKLLPQKSGQVSVYSIDGQMVKLIPVNPGEDLVTIDIRNLQSGVYLIKIILDDNVSTHRIIKH